MTAWLPPALLALTLAGTSSAQAETPVQRFKFVNVSRDAGLRRASHSPLANLDLSAAMGGGAVGDFNGDGYQDLFYLSGGRFADRLYINNQDGTFTDQAPAWGVARRHLGASAAVADYDDDGDQDLYVVSWTDATGAPSVGLNLLYRNDGDHFTEVAQEAGVATISQIFHQSFASAWGDYDLDGDLDLITTTYSAFVAGNRLFKNLLRETGEARFRDVTNASGILRSGICGFVPTMIDLNGDHYPELTLVSDHGSSQYFINDRDGTFTNRTELASGVEGAAGMGSAFGDLDNDGDLDWYVSSIAWDNIPGVGNKLLMNRGGGVFEDVSLQENVWDGGWGWGTLIVDLDHDTWNDMVETNGWLQGNNEWTGDPSYLYRNDQGQGFTEIGTDVGFEYYGSGRGLVNFDYDNDGDQDLLIFPSKDKAQLFRNEVSGQPNANWLRLELDTRQRPDLAPHGMGAKLTAVAGEQKYVACIDGGANHCSQGELGAHFGLGAIKTLDAVYVEWPDGRFSVLTDVLTNQILHVSAPVSSADFNHDGQVTQADLEAFLAAHAAGDLHADFDGDFDVDADDLAAFQALWDVEGPKTGGRMGLQRR